LLDDHDGGAFSHDGRQPWKMSRTTIGSEPEADFVAQQQAADWTSAASADRDHLLLSAGQEVLALAAPAPPASKKLEHTLQRPWTRTAELAADAQVFLDRPAMKKAGALPAPW